MFELATLIFLVKSVMTVQLIFCHVKKMSSYKILSTLQTDKASGHDDISARMLKEKAQLLYLTRLFGELPGEWKIACISPINKTDDPSKYHPISLLSILSKVLELHIGT